MLTKSLLTFILLVFSSHFMLAQVNLSNKEIDYENPREFIIGGIDIVGTKFLNHKTLIQLSLCEIGSRILVPGDKLTKALCFMATRLFSDVQIKVKSIQETPFSLPFYLKKDLGC